MESGHLTEKGLLGNHGAGSVQEALRLLQAGVAVCNGLKQGRKFNSSVLDGSCCLDLGYSLMDSSHLVASLAAQGKPLRAQPELLGCLLKTPSEAAPPLHSPLP